MQKPPLKYQSNFDSIFPNAPIPWYDERNVEEVPKLKKRKERVLPDSIKPQNVIVMEKALKKLAGKWFFTNEIWEVFIVSQIGQYHSYKIIIHFKMEVPFKDGHNRRMIELTDTKYLWQILEKGFGQSEEAIQKFKESLIQQIRDQTEYNLQI